MLMVYCNTCTVGSARCSCRLGQMAEKLRINLHEKELFSKATKQSRACKIKLFCRYIFLEYQANIYILLRLVTGSLLLFLCRFSIIPTVGLATPCVPFRLSAAGLDIGNT